MPHRPHYFMLQRGGARRHNAHQKHVRGERFPHRAHLQRERQTIIRQNLHQRGKAFFFKYASWSPHHPPHFIRKSVRQTMSGYPAGRASTSQVPDLALRTGAGTGVAPDSPSAEDSDDMSVTNSEVESAMNHRRWRVVLCDSGFSKEAFDAFSSADAYT